MDGLEFCGLQITFIWPLKPLSKFIPLMSYDFQPKSFHKRSLNLYRSVTLRNALTLKSANPNKTKETSIHTISLIISLLTVCTSSKYYIIVNHKFSHISKLLKKKKRVKSIAKLNKYDVFYAVKISIKVKEETQHTKSCEYLFQLHFFLFS